MLLVYGANGYTGELIVEECLRRGVRPIIAGRRADAISALAAAHRLEGRIFSLDDPAEVAKGLVGATVVLHAAGPFFITSKPMVDACLAAGIHYLDITGEIAVFEACRARDAQAQGAGVVLLPGVGFDVVPTDCLAASLSAALPDATHLEIAFHAGGSLSPGTAKTMLMGIGKGGAIREDGRIRRVPTAWHAQPIPFRDKTRLAVTIPWGDISTAWTSTRIPNIRTYLAVSPKRLRNMRAVRWLAPLASLGAVRHYFLRRIERTITGPSLAVRSKARTQIWARVRRDNGDSLEGTLVTPESYQLTAIAAVEAARRIMERPPAAGYHTPATAFGSAFVTELGGCDMMIGTRNAAPKP